jgi:predicted DNA binding CopG/RHH family protein
MASKKVSMGAKQPANLDTWVQKEPAAKPAEAPAKPAEKLKRLTLDIPEPLHKAIKTRSVQEGVTMVDMLRDLLDKHYGNK